VHDCCRIPEQTRPIGRSGNASLAKCRAASSSWNTQKLSTGGTDIFLPIKAQNIAGPSLDKAEHEGSNQDNSEYDHGTTSR
jgi:hypothetical protein